MLQEYVKGGYRVATSKTAQRTVLQTIFLASSSLILLGLSSIAYILFYRNYLPDQVLTIPLHLQYGRSQNPYAIAHLQNRNLKELQRYDISVSISLPRSPTNLDRGNFMLSLFLSADDIPPPPSPALVLSPTMHDPKTITHSRHLVYAESRPALLPYTDPTVSLASRCLFLFYHILFPAASSREELRVPMAEKVMFSSTRRLPKALLLEVASGGGGNLGINDREPPLRTYAASVSFTAQLSGLRWLMYQHRIISFVAFTTAFWICSMFAMLTGWLLVSLCLNGSPTSPDTQVVKTEQQNPQGPEATASSEQQQARAIKHENEEDGDYADSGRSSASLQKLPATPRTYASSSRGPPPSYETGSVVSSGAAGASRRANVGRTMRSPSGGQVPSTPDPAGSEDWDYEGGDYGAAGSSMTSTAYDDAGSRGRGGGAGAGGSSGILRRRSSQRSVSG